MDGFSSNTIPPPVAGRFSARSLQITIIISKKEINRFWTQVLQVSVYVTLSSLCTRLNTLIVFSFQHVCLLYACVRECVCVCV